MSSPSPPPHFHPPTPASTLLSRLLTSQSDPSTSLPLPHLRTGVGDIDNHLLAGGIQRGSIVGISCGDARSGRGGTVGGGREGEGEWGETGRLMAMHVLARTLLERPHAHASVIDSTGTFPVGVLAGVVRWCVERGVGAGVGGGRGRVEERVQGVLERVGITRVFDVEGLWEVLGEVGEGEGGEWGASVVGGERGVEDRDTSREGLDAKERDEHGRSAGEVQPGAGEREIMDSEDDTDDDDDLDIHTPPKPGPGPRPSSRNTTSNTHTNTAPPPATHHTTEIILIDNLTTLASTLFASTSTASAHALLSQLSRTLTTMTRSSCLTIFLLNTLVTKPVKSGPNDQGGRQHSVFAGMKATPSLGAVFDGFVDLSLMCYALPRGVEDAEGVYGGERPGGDDGDGAGDGRRENGQAGGGGRGVKFANVVEVLKDECSQLERWEGVSGAGRPGGWVDREQRWAAFRVVEGVGLVDEEFAVEGGTNG